MSEKIKNLRQKQNDTFLDKISFSSDGKSIDMFSGLNLEEELRLGRITGTNITVQNGVTIISELENNYKDNFYSSSYSTITAIKEKDNQTIILKVLYSLTNPELEPKLKVTILTTNTNGSIDIDEYYEDPTIFRSILDNWGVTL